MKQSKPPIDRLRSTYEVISPLNISPEYIIPKPEDLFTQQEKSLSEVIKFIATDIANKITNLVSSIKKVKDHVILYRFYENDESLKSVSDKQPFNNTKDLSFFDKDGHFSLIIKDKLLEQHTHYNNKVINITFYSPFVSTTEDLYAFINTTFSLRGDINLRQNVFNKAPLLGIFIVPQYMCFNPPILSHQKNPDYINLPHFEKEVCFDTTLGNLSQYKFKEIENPFRGHIKFNLAFFAKKFLSTQDIEKYNSTMNSDKIFESFFIENRNVLSIKLIDGYKSLYADAVNYSILVEKPIFIDEQKYNTLKISDLVYKKKHIDIIKQSKFKEDLKNLITENKLSFDHNSIKELIDEVKKQELNGLFNNIISKNIGYIHSYFGKYTIDALVSILQLKVSSLDEYSDIKIFQGLFVNRDLNNITEIVKEVTSSDNTILIPVNLFNKHAVGIVCERVEDSSYQIKYIDPMNKSIPEELLQIIQDILPNSQYEQIIVEQQKYANCGPEVIENFILYLTGNRVSQEKAIELHSKLVENSLLDLPTPDMHLLFEQPDYNGYQPDTCLSGDYNQETY